MVVVKSCKMHSIVSFSSQTNAGPVKKNTYMKILKYFSHRFSVRSIITLTNLKNI